MALKAWLNFIVQSTLEYLGFLHNQLLISLAIKLITNLQNYPVRLGSVPPRSTAHWHHDRWSDRAPVSSAVACTGRGAVDSRWTAPPAGPGIHQTKAYTHTAGNRLQCPTESGPRVSS